MSVIFFAILLTIIIQIINGLDFFISPDKEVILKNNIQSLTVNLKEVRPIKNKFTKVLFEVNFSKNFRTLFFVVYFLIIIKCIINNNYKPSELTIKTLLDELGYAVVFKYFSDLLMNLNFASVAAGNKKMAIISFLTSLFTNYLFFKMIVKFTLLFYLYLTTNDIATILASFQKDWQESLLLILGILFLLFFVLYFLCITLVVISEYILQFVVVLLQHITKYRKGVVHAIIFVVGVILNIILAILVFTNGL